METKDNKLHSDQLSYQIQKLFSFQLMYFCIQNQQNNVHRTALHKQTKGEIGNH